MQIEELCISDALHYNLEKKFSSEEFSGLCSFCRKNLPSVNELFIAVQERLKWLTFFQQGKPYLLSVVTIPAPCALHD